MQNLRFSTAHVKFHQICILIGYFCWKYIKFQVKKGRSSYVSWYQRVVENLKRNLIFVSKITRIWWTLIRALRSLKNLHFDWSLLFKVYNIWPKKNYRGAYFITLKSHLKFEEKLTCGLKNDKQFGKFSSEHLKMSKLIFSWDPFVQSRKCMSDKLTEAL